MLTDSCGLLWGSPKVWFRSGLSDLYSQPQVVTEATLAVKSSSRQHAAAAGEDHGLAGGEVAFFGEQEGHHRRDFFGGAHAGDGGGFDNLFQVIWIDV